MSNTFYGSFTGPLDSQSVTRICAALNHAVNEGFGEAYLCFSSLGGYTSDGVFLYNHLRALPIKTTLHATGNIASIALAGFVGADVRKCSQYAIFMTHPTSVPGSAEGITWERLKSFTDAAIAEDDRTENILRERCSIDDATLQGRRFRDVHFTPQDAIKYGVAHTIEEFALPSGANISQI